MKDAKGNEKEKMVKQYENMEEEDIKVAIRKFLLSNDATEIDKESLKYFNEELREIEDHFVNHNSKEIRGASLLFILDNS